MKEQDIRSRETLNNYLELVAKDCAVYFRDKGHFVVVSCCVCGSESYDFQFSKNGFDYVTCQDCRTLYVRNRPSFEKLKEFYARSESSTYWTNYFFKPVLEARRTKIFQPRVESIIEHFGGKQNWTVGDVGAGFGIFLEELRKYWKESRFIAIEPSLEQAEICRGLGVDVECSFVEELKEYDGKFDLLTAFELFEHLNEPARFVEKIYELLKPGGYFLMTTLNGEGFDIQLLWENSKSVTPPHHLNFINPQSLSKLLSSVGFILEDCTTPGKLDWDIVEGMITKEKKKVGRFWEMFASQGTVEAKQELQDWISKHNMSSHIKVLARKPEKIGGQN